MTFRTSSTEHTVKIFFCRGRIFFHHLINSSNCSGTKKDGYLLKFREGVYEMNVPKCLTSTLFSFFFLSLPSSFSLYTIIQHRGEKFVKMSYKWFLWNPRQVICNFNILDLQKAIIWNRGKIFSSSPLLIAKWIMEMPFEKNIDRKLWITIWIH